MRNTELAEEIAGMIADEIGDRLRGGPDGSDAPGSVNWYPEGTTAVIVLEDGRRVLAAVTVQDVCRHCRAVLAPSGPRPDWAAVGVPDWPVLFCPARGDAFPAHEPAEGATIGG